MSTSITQSIKAAVLAASQAPKMGGIYVKSITVSALYKHMQYAWVTITWSMPDVSIDAPEHSKKGVKATIISRPADTVIKIPVNSATPAEIDEALLQLAWELGAWDMCRLERAPLTKDQNWHEPRYGLLSAFGRDATNIAGTPLQQGASAADWVLEHAAKNGYVAWRFIPLALATPFMRKRWGGVDATLQADCMRAGETKMRPAQFYRPSAPNTVHEQQYQLGRKVKHKEAASTRGAK